MRKVAFVKFVILIIIMTGNQKISAQTSDRSAIEPKYTWNLQDIFSSDEAWKQAFDKVKAEADNIVKYQGKLNTSAKILFEFLEFSSTLNKEISRVYSYASMKSDQDTRDGKYLSMLQELSQSFAVIGAKWAFSDPEVLAMGKDKVTGFLKEDSGLSVYKMYFDNLFRSQAHTLSEPEEKIMAQASVILDAPGSINRVFTNAEFPYPTVTLSDGKTVTLDQSAFSKYRALPNRTDRELVFKEFWTTMNQFKKTLAEQLFSQVNGHIFNARARHYKNSLESALEKYNIPTSVYHSLVSNVNNNLGTFHRYLKLRKRMMGLDTLKYSDMYAPVVKDVTKIFTFDEAQTLVVSAMKPLGKPYQDVLKKAYTDRWVDVYPNTGKQSGAYSNGSIYDVHPFILLNFNGQFNDVSTYGHELGHAMHSYFSNKTQPYPQSSYSIFVAEVASTFNEALLSQYMVENTTDENDKLSLLMDRLDGFKGTLFRQTQFAEFELIIHEKAEAGEPLSSDDLNKIYGDILKKYYGTNEGICKIDKIVDVEWAFIPHFYYNFYVYQYATSFIASMALAEKVMNSEKGIVEKYLNFLSSGSTDYPIELLKKAGVDMTTNEPFEKAIQSMNKIMDEIEVILSKKR